MINDKYRNELDNIKASEEFKEKTISLLNEKSHQITETPPKTIKFKNKKYISIAACAAIIIFIFPLLSLNNRIKLLPTQENTKSRKYASTQVSAFNASSQNGPEKSIPAFLTKEDSKPFEFKNNKSKSNNILYSYNGVLSTKNLTYLKQNIQSKNTFSIYDDFKELPIYSFSPMSFDKAIEEANKICEYFDFSKDKLTYCWKDTVDKDNNFNISNSNNAISKNGKNYTTNEPISPNENAHLISIEGLSENGKFCLNIYTGKATIYLSSEQNSTLSEKIDKMIEENNFKYYTVSNDDKNYTCFYKSSENYGENILNSTLKNIVIMPSDNEFLTKFTITYGLYKEIEKLPSIDYKQSLYLLYNNLLDEDNNYKVFAVDLVYLNSFEYDMLPNSIANKNYAVPFYKLYISDSINSNSSNTDFSIYYICAIHPDYITEEISNKHIYRPSNTEMFYN